MRLVFVMDVLQRVDPEKDTTFGMIEAAVARGHRCDHCLIHHVERMGERVTAMVRPMECTRTSLNLGPDFERVDLAEVDAVLIRKDPPFDDAYLYATQLLEGLRGRTVMMNDPRGLREANEKLYTLHFAELMPRTMVSSQREAILSFVDEVGGRAVIKPLDGAGGYGVLALRKDDSNLRAIVDVLTSEGAKLAMVQEYLPAVKEGDKRVIMLDGESMGAILRVPTGGDMRANIHVGGSVQPTELTQQEQRVVAAVGPRLRDDGLTFVGLDLIGEKLTEVNVTSPTGIRELSRFTGERKSDDVIAWIEEQAAALGGG